MFADMQTQLDQMQGNARTEEPDNVREREEREAARSRRHRGLISGLNKTDTAKQFPKGKLSDHLEVKKSNETLGKS